jgi:hypothetical protein
MATLEEAALAKGPLAAALATGVDVVSQFQELTFTKYVRTVLPLDGFVFWVRADQLEPSAVAAASQGFIPCPDELVIKASIHYATDKRQLEDETIAVNRMVVTAEQPSQFFNEIGPCILYVGEWQGNRFSFSGRSSFYAQADLYHYTGDAIYPAMQSQIIDDVNDFDPDSLVVSNSLPLWLALTTYAPVWLASSPLVPLSFPLFPSFAVPDNLRPPYASVHIEPTQTQALQSAPSLDAVTMSHDQLARDMVRITLYGVRNDAALSFVDLVNDFSVNMATLGIMNVPVMRDEKRAQTELAILAQKKVIDYEVSYLQSAVRDVAQQIIKSAIPSFTISETST